MKASWSAPGSGVRRASSASSRLLIASSCRTLPQVNDRRIDPSVESARTPSNKPDYALCRSRSMSFDRVRPGHHPGDQAADLDLREHSDLRRDPHVLAD